MTDTLDRQNITGNPQAGVFTEPIFDNGVPTPLLKPEIFYGTPPSHVDQTELSRFGDAAAKLSGRVVGLLQGNYSSVLVAEALQEYLGHVDSHVVPGTEMHPAIERIHVGMLRFMERKFPVERTIPNTPIFDHGNSLDSAHVEPPLPALAVAEVATVSDVDDLSRRTDEPSSANEPSSQVDGHITPPQRPTRRERTQTTALERAYAELEGLTEAQLQKNYEEYGRFVEIANSNTESPSERQRAIVEVALARRLATVDIVAHDIAAVRSDTRLLARHPWSLRTIADVKLGEQRLALLQERYSEDDALQKQILLALDDLGSAEQLIRDGGVVEPSPLNDNDNRNIEDDSTGTGPSGNPSEHRSTFIAPPVRPNTSRDDLGGVGQPSSKPPHGPPSVFDTDDTAPSLVSRTPLDNIEKANGFLAYLQSLEQHPKVDKVALTMAVLSLENYISRLSSPQTPAQGIPGEPAEAVSSTLATPEEPVRAHSEYQSPAATRSRRLFPDKLVLGRRAKQVLAFGVGVLLFKAGVEGGEMLAKLNSDTQMMGSAATAEGYKGTALSHSNVLTVHERSNDQIEIGGIAIDSAGLSHGTMPPDLNPEE